MNDTTDQATSTPSAPSPPAPPGPNASPYEWRAYRHELRHYTRGYRFGSQTSWGWGVFFATGLILVGIYYVLRNAGLLPWFPDGVFWPLILIAWGVMLLVRIGTRSRRA